MLIYMVFVGFPELKYAFNLHAYQPQFKIKISMRSKRKYIYTFNF